MKKISELTQIDIASGMNGYPKDIRIGYIGFDSIEEAEQFASETNGRVVLLHKKDGWHFYESKGDTSEPLTVDNYLKDLGDNYYSVDEDFVHELIAVNVQEMESKRLVPFLKDQIRILEEIAKATETQTVICCYGEFYETVENEMMGYHQDVHTYVIGVEVR